MDNTRRTGKNPAKARDLARGPVRKKILAAPPLTFKPKVKVPRRASKAGAMAAPAPRVPVEEEKASPESSRTVHDGGPEAIVDALVSSLREQVDCKQLKAQLEKIFRSFKERAILANKEALDVLRIECEQHLASQADEADKPYRGYGGNPGNDYFQCYVEKVAIPSGTQFVRIVKAAFNADIPERAKNTLAKAVRDVLLDGWGSMRWEIARVALGPGHRRPFGIRTDGSMYDPVHAYPGWYRIVKERLRTGLLEALESHSTEDRQIDFTDASWIAQLRAKNIHVLDHKIDELREAEINLAVAPAEIGCSYIIGINSDTLHEDAIRSLEADIWCCHSRFDPSQFHGITSALLAMDPANCAKELSENLFQLLKKTAPTTIYMRGQAAILLWELQIWSQACGHKMKVADSWLEQGTRENLAMDQRVLCAFDEAMLEREWKTAVSFIPVQETSAQ